jgi:DNA-binding PadR family transcriptional regulator
MDNRMMRDVFLAFVRVHILHHAAEGRIFGLEMMEELRRHGYEISPGTLYPILHRLHKAGYLRLTEEVEAGKLRKYYIATAKGKKALAEMQLKVRELVREVLHA